MAKTIVLDIAEMADGSTYSNVKFIRVIGYILLAILGAAQVYAIGLMIFFYLAFTSSQLGENQIPSTVTVEDYNITGKHKIAAEEGNATKVIEVGKRVEHINRKKIYSREEKIIWERAKDGKLYGAGYYEGKNLNIQNEKGQTPLMIAVKNGYYELILGFSEGILDLSIKDNEGKTAYDYIKVPTNRKEKMYSERTLGSLKMAEAAQIFRDRAYISELGYKNATGIVNVSIMNAECSDFELPKHIQCKD